VLRLRLCVEGYPGGFSRRLAIRFWRGKLTVYCLPNSRKLTPAVIRMRNSTRVRSLLGRRNWFQACDTTFRGGELWSLLDVPPPGRTSSGTSGYIELKVQSGII
jgi:hypothetical protein